MSNYLAHSGKKGMKWDQRYRKYQDYMYDPNGNLKKQYYTANKFEGTQRAIDKRKAYENDKALNERVEDNKFKNPNRFVESKLSRIASTNPSLLKKNNYEFVKIGKAFKQMERDAVSRRREQRANKRAMENSKKNEAMYKASQAAAYRARGGAMSSNSGQFMIKQAKDANDKLKAKAKAAANKRNNSKQLSKLVSNAKNGDFKKSAKNAKNILENSYNKGKNTASEALKKIKSLARKAKKKMKPTEKTTLKFY